VGGIGGGREGGVALPCVWSVCACRCIDSYRDTCRVLGVGSRQARVSAHRFVQGFLVALFVANLSR
jgi:hypothetical protein